MKCLSKYGLQNGGYFVSASSVNVFYTDINWLVWHGPNAILDCIIFVGKLTFSLLSLSKGDSGSPMSCLVEGNWRLAGVYSWYIKCVGLPSVYTRVSSYLDWVRNHMIE